MSEVFKTLEQEVQNLDSIESWNEKISKMKEIKEKIVFEQQKLSELVNMVIKNEIKPENEIKKKKSKNDKQDLDSLVSSFKEANNLEEKMKNFDPFTYKEIFEWNQYEKYVKVEKNDFVLDLGCSKGYFYFKNCGLDINYLGVDGSIDCIKDFIENLNQNESPKLINAVISKNKVVHVEPLQIHQVINTGHIPLRIVEVWTGEFLAEEDIVRLENV
jgi:hypothetical protein